MTILEERIAGLTRIEKDPARHLLYYRHCLAVGTVHALQGAEKDIVIFLPSTGATIRTDRFFSTNPTIC
jgi:superfamily I DNA and/or RNA helicase